MKNNVRRKTAALVVFAVVVFLFCERITGVPLHIIIGLIFIIVLSFHTWRRRKRMFTCPKTYGITDAVTCIAMLGVLISGLMLKPFKDVMAVLMLHKISSVVFVAGLLVHMRQHVRSQKISY